MRTLLGSVGSLGALVALAAGAGLCAQADPPPQVEQQAPATVVDTPLGQASALLDRPIAGKEKWTLWLRYPSALGDYRDHATYLADLQTRYGDQGVRIVVGLPDEDARAVARQAPGVSIARFGVERDVGPGVACALVPAHDATQGMAWGNFDGAVDRIDAALGDGFDPANADADQLVDSLLNALGDGGDYREQVEHCLQAMPRSGRAHAAAVLFHWWCTGDLAAARKAVDNALRALSGESVPLCVFADFALRGDRTDKSIAKTLAMALAPAAATAPDGVFTQLVYLRALVLAGQDRLAGRVAATLQKHLQGRPMDQLYFAETLMEAGDAKPYRDLAERAIERAQQGGVDGRLVYAARHKVLFRCGAEGQQIEALLTEYRASEAFGNSFNNDAWYMVTEPSTMGRFDTLALAQVEAMLQQEGERMTSGNKDTVALVLFLNGRLQEAADLQTVAARANNNDPVYVGRLTRYQNALAAQRAAAKADEIK